MGVGEPPPVFRLQGNDCFGLFLLTCRLPQVISRMLELRRTPTSCGPYCWSVRAAGEMMRVKRTIKVLALPFTSCQYWGRSPHLSNPDAPSAAQRTGRLISLTLMHLARPKGRYRPIGGFKITVLDCSCGRKNVLQQTKKDFFLYRNFQVIPIEASGFSVILRAQPFQRRRNGEKGPDVPGFPLSAP